MSRPRVSAVVVTYNSAAFLRETLDALVTQTGADFEALLWDNASADESLAIAREFEPRGLRVVASEENFGFGGGNNRAVRETGGDIVLLLNPDCILPPGGLRRIAAAMARNPRIAVFGGKQVAPDGETLLHCGGVIDDGAHTRSIGRGQKDRGQYDRPRQVDYVGGALMALRRDVWEELGGFDDAFHPAYYEDTDLCARARRHGHQVWYAPIRVLHHENVSLPRETAEFRRLHHRNRLRFAALDFGIPRLLLRFLPAELRWLLSWHSAGSRRLCAALYPDALGLFLRRRILRRRP